MNRLIGGVMLALVTGMICGCTTEAIESQLDRKAGYAGLEPQDVRRTVEKMVDSMLTDREFIKELGEDRPVLDISGIRNNSTMIIDMKSITDSIRTKLVRSRKFRFVDRSSSATDLEFMNDQQLNGMTDPTKAVAAGQQSAAQLYLYGDLSEMRHQEGRVIDRYFKFTLNMKDLRSGEIVWTDEQEIRKVQKKAFIGL